MFHLSHKALRNVLAAGVVAIAAVVASPVTAANGRTLLPVKCHPTPARWVVANVNVAIPQFVLLPAKRCTETVDNPAGNCAPGSPYPGWVQVMDEIGRPTLIPTGSEAAAASSCTGRGPAQTAPTPSVTPSPYPGWVVVTDDQGVSTLVPLSNIR
jgi:hypothetical protein